MLQVPALATTSQFDHPHDSTTTNNATSSSDQLTNVVCKGRLLMLYAGAGNKLVQRHIELANGAKMKIFLENNALGDAGEPQATISLQGCVLADYPENAALGFSLCRSSDGFTISRLGQFIFVCFSVEDKRKWMWAIQQEIFRQGGEDALQTNADSTGEAKRSSLNKFRFNTESYVIDRGCRPPLLRGFFLKRTGNFLQEYVVRWMELRDRVSNDNPTTLGGIVYASYVAAPPSEWSFLPMRVDTKVSSSPEKFRVAISGPNQDSVFLKFDGLEVMEEWYQNLDMLIERAKIENDPQFAMAMKLNERGGSKEKDDDYDSLLIADQLGETMAIGKLKKEMMELNWGGEDDDDEKGNENITQKPKRRNNKQPPTTSPQISSVAQNNMNMNQLQMVNAEEDEIDSEDEYEISDLESDVPMRVHFMTVLYCLTDQPKTISADRDSSDKVVPLLMEIITSPIRNFRPDFSPYRPQGKTAQMYYEKEKEIENKSFGIASVNISTSTATAASTTGVTFNNNNNNNSLQLVSHKANQQNRSSASNSNTNNNNNVISYQQEQQSAVPSMTEEEVKAEKIFRPENPTVEDVLERFERHTLMAIEVLGPSPVLIRLRNELDEDSSDLKYVALHILNAFPRELKAAYLAQRIDNALNDYSSIREAVLVRIDMAKFREEFRLDGTNSTAAPILGNPSSLTAAFAKKKESNLNVDEALRTVERATTECALMRDPNATFVTGVKRASETNAKIRDSIQFLQHFLKQFRENFDVFDDAGYLVEEVGNAIEKGTKFLQEL